jgi:hypothetical protein
MRIVVLPLRQVLKLYEKQREQSQRGDRVLREDSTMRSAESVWSDVASSRGMGFRSGDAGPLLHGDLSSGGAIEIGLYEAAHSDVYCTVATIRGREDLALGGELSCRPHDAVTRLLRMFRKQPELREEVLARYFFLSSPVELATKLLGNRPQKMLCDLSDRGPRLYWEKGATTLVLEGIELVHERLEAMIEALTDIDGAGHAR